MTKNNKIHVTNEEDASIEDVHLKMHLAPWIFFYTVWLGIHFVWNVSLKDVSLRDRCVKGAFYCM